jgi:hypothetical protein
MFEIVAFKGWSRHNALDLYSGGAWFESRPPACLLVFAELISSTLKMEAICSSETSVETQRNTRCHIPEDDTLHNHRHENLKSYNE